MNENITKERNLLERFSSSLIGRGKKSSGHKILLESLFFLRQNTDKPLLDLLLQKVKKEGLKNSLQNNSSKNSNQLLTNKTNLEEKQEKEKKVEKTLFFKKTKNKEDLQDKDQNPTQRLKSEKIPLSTFLNKSICKTCVDNVKPILETRKVRKGRVTYRVPLVTHTVRQEGKAVSFLIEAATLKKKAIALNPQKSVETKHLNNLFVESYTKGLPQLPIVDRHSPLVSTSGIQSELLFFSNISESKIPQKDTLSIKEFQIKLNRNFLSFLLKKELSYNASLKRLNLYSIKHALSEEFFDSFFEKGESVEKKKQLHSTALQNRAYTHYRWW